MERRGFITNSIKVGAAIVAGAGVTSGQAHAARPAPMPDEVSETALRHFLEGKKTCVEAMLLTGVQALGIKDPLIPDIGLGLAGGIGHHGKTCAVVTGAVMVASLAASQNEQALRKKRKAALASAGKIMREFEKRHGSTECRALCGLDLMTATGRAKLMAGVKQNTCSKFVDTGARLMAEAIAAV